LLTKVLEHRKRRKAYSQAAHREKSRQAWAGYFARRPAAAVAFLCFPD
jgi:hypothetical protein